MCASKHLDRASANERAGIQGAIGSYGEGVKFGSISEDIRRVE